MTELGENPGIKMGLFSDPASRRVLVNILLVVGLYLVIGLLRPAFLSSGSFWSLSQQTSVLLLVALGATFVVMMGMIDLSIGSLVTLSAMVLAVSHPMLGDGAVLFAIAVTTAVGALNGVVITAFRLPSFLVTLGSLSIIQGVTLTISPSYVRFQSDLVDFIAIQRLFGVVPVLTVIAVVMAVLFVLVARYSVFGRGAYVRGTGRVLGLASDQMAIRGTWGAAILDDVAMDPTRDEFAIDNGKVDPFTCTEFEVLLRNLNRNVIMIAGLACNFGVEMAARSGNERDYGICVVSDCVDRFLGDYTERTLTDLLPLYGRVETSDVLIRELESQ